MTEFQQDIPENIFESEKRPEVEDIIAWGEKALSGEFDGDISGFSEAITTQDQTEHPAGEFDVADTVVLDLNSERYSDGEKNRLLGWVVQKIGSDLINAPVRDHYIFADETGGFKVFDKEFGTPVNRWFITEWQNDGEQPSYVIWSASMIEMQEDMGYSKS